MTPVSPSNMEDERNEGDHVADAQKRSVSRRLTVIAVILAAGYGLAARAFFGSEAWFRTFQFGFHVMSLAFIFGVPFVMGFLVVVLARIRRWYVALVLPQVPALAALGTALALAWEGLICILLWLPLFMVLAAVGGLLGFAALRLLGRRGRRSVLGIALILPYGFAVPEGRLDVPREVRSVETSIQIDATPHEVWREIVEVPPIGDEEHTFAWSHFIGFPRPVAARASGTGVGSLREASFERGVVFTERVTTFEPEQELSFSIHADPNSIPARALDQHVTVGGEYFDVLEGMYRLVPRDRGVELQLSSEYRLSTNFNGYAGLWTDFIMRDTQNYILRIVAKRAQSQEQ